MWLWFSLAAVPILIGMNAFFVAAEYAVVASRPAVMERLRQRGRHHTVNALLSLMADPAGAIGAIQICITMTNLLIGWIAEPAMSELIRRSLGPAVELAPGLMSVVSIAVGFILVTLITVVFSELLPKALTLKYVPAAASFTAVPVLWIQRCVRPLVWLMTAMANAVTVPLRLGRVDVPEQQHITLEELRMQISQATADGIITPRERSVILNALTIGKRPASQIVVPRTQVAYLDLQESMESNRRVVESQLYTRLPLCDGDMDHVIGVVKVKDFLTAYHAGGDSVVLQLIAERPVFVPETIALDQLLERMNEHHTQFIFVADEYGGIVGIVTLQDVVDELLGDRTPHDLPAGK